MKVTIAHEFCFFINLFNMKVKVTLFLCLCIQASANDILLDCMDAEDRLRCKKTCPEKRQITDKTCPFNRVCCLGKPNSIFLPLRDAPFYRPPKRNYSRDTSFVFPDEFLNYVNKHLNKTSTTEGPTYIEDSNYLNLDELRRKLNTKYTKENNRKNIYKKINPERKSIRYCRKYTELTYDYLYASPVLPKIIPFRIRMDNCLPQLFLNPLVVGGKNATRGEYPHMVALGFNKTDFIDYLCGGTLISEKYILTAAHCTKTKWGQPVVAMLGDVELYSPESTEIGIARVIPHPDYRKSSYYNDIALVELKKEVEFSHYIRPACLAQPNTKAQNPGSVTIATGWGKTGAEHEDSMYLLKVYLRIIENRDCNVHYARESRFQALKDGINDKLICAIGHKSEFHDTCQGDSGGPLQAFIPGHKCMLEVVGVTSFGKRCGSAIPAVYTKVEPYISWIESIVWP